METKIKNNEDDYKKTVSSFNYEKLDKEKECLIRNDFIPWREFREKIKIICELENEKRLLLSK